jgi:hypothetical protein
MALQIKLLKEGTLATSEGDLYVVPTTKTAIVKSIRLVNTGSAAATVNLFVRHGSGGTSRQIVPKNLTLPAGAALIDDSEITLEGSTNADRIRGFVNSGGTVDCVISGVERE